MIKFLFCLTMLLFSTSVMAQYSLVIPKKVRLKETKAKYYIGVMSDIKNIYGKIPPEGVALKIMENYVRKNAAYTQVCVDIADMLIYFNYTPELEIQEDAGGLIIERIVAPNKKLTSEEIHMLDTLLSILLRLDFCPSNGVGPDHSGTGGG